MKILGLIPARAASKGIPGKNLRPIQGHPLIHYSIGPAIRSGVLDTIVVCSESPEVLDATAPYPVKRLRRPDDLARDHSPTLPTLEFAVRELAKEGLTFDAVMLLQVTAPTRTSAMIRDAVAAFASCKEATSLVSVQKTPSHGHPFWSRKVVNGWLETFIEGTPLTQRRQDLPDAYVRDGKMYLTRTQIIESGDLYGPRALPFFVEEDFPINLDSELDWFIFESLVNAGKIRIEP